MKQSVGSRVLEYLEKLLNTQDVIEEEGQMAAPATDSSATGGTLPVPLFGKPAKRKSLEDDED